MRNDLYLDNATLELTFDQLKSILISFGVNKLFHKALSPNDNGKNQPYFGSNTSLLQVLPTGDSTVVESSSRRYGKETKKSRIKSPMKFYWISPYGDSYLAPKTQIVTYPQYPELRFSGFISGASSSPSTLMNSEKRGREVGRHLFLGIAGEKVYGFMVPARARLASEIENLPIKSVLGALNEIPITEGGDADLLKRLKYLYERGCQQACKMDKRGETVPYSKPNSAGYTLEAWFDISPNSEAKPDYMGWELKTHRAKAGRSTNSSPSTLMTPEPDKGFYAVNGVEAFVRKYGYPDRNDRPDRLNFGGIHRAGQVQKLTGLCLNVTGFDAEKSIIVDAKHGAVGLYDSNENLVLGWSFIKIIDHWKRKHNKTAYVTMNECSISESLGYTPGKIVKLGKGTKPELFLKSLCSGHTYYDPGIKLENYSTALAKSKARSQIRIKNANLSTLYSEFEEIDLTQLS